MGDRILIVGCGQLGTRHLQAVATLPGIREIEVVDPNPTSLKLGKTRLGEIKDLQSGISFRWLSKLEEANRNGDLCVVATQAAGRCRLVVQISEMLGYNSFLLEKTVSQSANEYEDLLKFSNSKGLSIWVNCKTRAYPVHKYIKQRLGSAGPILFNAVGGNHGLANNGVHTADLFVFYDQTDEMEPIGSAIDPVLHPSKRGEHIFDLSGTLQGRTKKGSHFTLSYARDYPTSEYISINAAHYRCIVDHMQRWAVESDADSGWSWKPILFEGNLAVSVMTKAFASDILKTGRCELPTLEECFPAHKFILEMLQPHFSHLMKKKLDHCPIT